MFNLLMAMLAFLKRNASKINLSKDLIGGCYFHSII